MELINNCPKLPFSTRWHVRRALSWIHPLDLDGIGFIQLIDKLPAPSSVAEDWHKQAAKEDFSVEGLYVRRNDARPAHIILFIQDLYRSVPAIFYVTPVPTLLIGRSLAHEVAHHMVAQRGHIFEPNERYQQSAYEEEMANRYAFAVIRRARRRWVYKLGAWLSKRLAGYHNAIGFAEWKAKKYEQAAERWYSAWLLDPDRQELVDCYWRAKEMIKSMKKP